MNPNERVVYLSDLLKFAVNRGVNDTTKVKLLRLVSRELAVLANEIAKGTKD